MIQLSGNLTVVRPPKQSGAHIYRVSTDPNRPAVLAKSECFLAGGNKITEGFAVGLYREGVNCPPESEQGIFILPQSLAYLADGDVIRLSNRGELRVLFRKEAKMNFFLLTERCSNSCLMCSQPPKNVIDDYLVDEVKAALQLLPPTTAAIGFTGGEPTLLGERFVELVQIAAAYLPGTDLHVLSNGRSFKDGALAKRLAALRHSRLSIGIPLYSAIPANHDFIVQAKGAFNETILGLYALREAGIKTEIRIVVHRQTASSLPMLADFIFRNLTFVDHIAFMGLERTGFAKANDELLWIDPAKYRAHLASAVQQLSDYGMTVSIYNLPYCLLDDSIWNYAKQSISDWKNEYLPGCQLCDLKSECCGFFVSDGLRQSVDVAPIKRSVNFDISA